MTYRLYYWPGLPGRGEYVRLVLEQAGVGYDDVAQQEGPEAMVDVLQGALGGIPPLAPPILQHGELVIAQVANVCAWLAGRHGLAPAAEDARLHAHQLQLTIADLVAETHDTHHPLATGWTYEEQREAAVARAGHFRQARLPKFLGYFERVLAATGGPFLLGSEASYVDLSLFQTLEGLAWAFPQAAARATAKTPVIVALRDRVAALQPLAAYLASDRRQAFNQRGIFRRYPELDG